MNSKVSWKSEVQQPIEVREQVSEVSVDMWGGFPKVIQEVFPNAVVVYPSSVTLGRRK
jgi:transposase